MATKPKPVGKQVLIDCPMCKKSGQIAYSRNTTYCRTCHRNYTRQMYHLKRLKPLLLKRQKGRCAICRKDLSELPTGQVHVDHIHGTGKVRGLLCKPCNTALGMFEDKLPRLKAAVAYLEAAKPEDPKKLLQEVE